MNGEGLPAIYFRGQSVQWFQTHRWVSEQKIINFVHAKYLAEEIDIDSSVEDEAHGIVDLRIKERNSLYRITIRIHQVIEYDRITLIIYRLHMEEI